MSIQQDTIKTFMRTLIRSDSSGARAVDEAVSAATGGRMKTWNALVTQFVNEVSAHGGKSTYGMNYSKYTSGPDSRTDQFLRNYCGINLKNADTGALIGTDAGGSSVKTASSIVPEDTSATLYLPGASSSTYKGLTIVWPSSSELTTEDAKKVIAGLYTWWRKSCLDLIQNTYGLSYEDSTARNHTMTITFESKPNSATLASANSTNLTINLGRCTNLNLSDGNGKSSKSSFYLDRTLAHELTHAVMCTNMTSYLWNDIARNFSKSVLEGLAELVHGVDDERLDEICALAQSGNASKLKAALLNPPGDYNSYAGGYMIFRYLGHQMYLILSPYNYKGGNVTLSNYDTSQQIKFGAAFRGVGVSGNNFQMFSSSGTLTITNCRDRLISIADGNGKTLGYAYMAGKAQTIDGSSRSGLEVLVGSNSGKDNIIAGSGGSTLWGGSGNVSDTLQGGSGRDEFLVSMQDGKDVVIDYQEKDVLRFYSGGINGMSISGDDLTIGGVTVKDCRDELITVTNQKGSKVGYAYLSGKGGTVDGRGTSVAEIVIGADNASDTLLAGNGGATIWGGSGNSSDTLVGGKGADLYVYGGEEGADVIRGSNASDRVLFYSPVDFKSISMQENNLVIQASGDNSLTVSNWSEKGMNNFQMWDGSRYKLHNKNGSISVQRIK